MNVINKKIRTTVLSRLILFFTALTSHVAIATDSWDKIFIVQPKIEIDDNNRALSSERLTTLSHSAFNQAITAVKAQMPLYFADMPQFEEYEYNKFYQQENEKGEFFLHKLFTATQTGLVIYGSISLNQQQRTLTIKMDGYDKQKQTDVPVYLEEFSINSIDYLQEVYTELIFAVMNRPKNGLKPRYVYQ